jgi:hypothetical protein
MKAKPWKIACLLGLVIEVDVRKVALTTPQVRSYNPPPNPAKVSDSRAASYIAKHGPYSWEVDALPPEELQSLIRQAFESVVDDDAMQAIKDREEEHKEALRKAVVSITGKEDA